MATTSLDTYQRLLLDTVQGCGNTLLDTIDHVLDFSKVNNFKKNWQVSNNRTEGLLRGSLTGPSDFKNHLAITMSTVQVAAVVEEVIDTLAASRLLTSGLGLLEISNHGRDVAKSGGQDSPQSSELSVDIILDIQHGDWAFITQAGAIRRIVQNLVGNALKYASIGSVTVQLRQECTAGDRNTIVLKVTDTGRGIGQRFLNTKLFSAFAQEDVLAPGSGLGLSIVRDLVIMLGGTVSVSSEVGRGTQVEVLLPMERGVISPNATQTLAELRTDSLNVGNRIRTLQSLSSHYRVSIRLSDELLERLARQYVQEWARLEVVTVAADMAAASIAIVDESNLDKCITAAPDSAFVLLCDVRPHQAHHILQHSSSSIIELVAKPLGPYKLAKGLSSVARRLEKALALPDAEIVTPAIPHRSSTARPTDTNLTGLRDVAQSAGCTLHHEVPQESSEESGMYTSTSAYAQSSSQTSGQKSKPIYTTTTDRATTCPTKSSSMKYLPRQPRVLVVDDNKLNLNLLQMYLRKKRKYIQVDTAEDGQQALERFETLEKRYDIIFMDISMPVMNGFEATRAIRECDPSSDDTLIVALTGLASAADQREAFQSGMDIYFRKPVSFKVLGDLLDDWEAIRPGLRERFGAHSVATILGAS